jgi:hypothetical protein
MSQPSVSTPLRERNVIEHGRLSPWALVALVLGVLSPAAIVGPLLWFVPVLAVVVALIALRQIARSEGQFTGWYLALFGLLAAIFFGMAGPARTMSRRHILEERSARFAEKFIDLLRHNQPWSAYQLTLPAGTRKPEASTQTEPSEKDEQNKKHYDEFLKLDPIKNLLHAGAAAKAEWEPARFVGGDEIRDDVAVGVRITGIGDNPSKPAEFIMYVERTLAYGSHTEQWEIIPPALRERTE